jgi:hypothetical protein
MIDLAVTAQDDEIRISGNLEGLSGDGEFELWVRSFDRIAPENILSGGEAIQSMVGNCLGLKDGLRSFEIVLREGSR